METRLEEELALLKQELLDMAAKVEGNIGAAFEGLRKRDQALLEKVIGNDIEIDLAELQIDEHCISILALRQPVARDLRFIATALKIVKDIERVGDIAKNISKHGLGLIRTRPVSFPTELSRMVEIARELLRESLDAFVTQDAVLARQVIERDDQVDRLHKENVEYLLGRMVGDSSLINSMTQLLSVNKFVERIGDHSTNIAAMVVFMVEGRDIRHPRKRLISH